MDLARRRLGVGEYPKSIAALSNRGDLEFIADRIFGDDPDSKAKARFGNAVMLTCRPHGPDGGEVVTIGSTDWATTRGLTLCYGGWLSWVREWCMIEQLSTSWPVLTGCTLSELPGEFDRNFRVERDGVFTHVLKVMRAGLDPELIDMQAAAITRCAKAGIPTSTVVPTMDGASFTRISEHGETHLVWLVDACPGIMLDDLVHFPDALVADIARSVPQIHAAISDMDMAALDRQIKWDMQDTTWVANAASVIPDPAKRDLVVGIAERHLGSIQPRLRSMPQVPIHNDLNPNNVFVVEAGVGQWTMSAVIDFGDMVRGARIIDFAILSAYLLALTDRPIDLLAMIVAAANNVATFRDDELEVLLPLIEMRLATSVINSATMKIDAPDDPYVVVSEAKSWSLLDRLAGEDHEVVLARMRVASSRPATISSSAIRQHLDEVRTSVAQVLPTLEPKAAPLLDMSVLGSTIPKNPFGDPPGVSFSMGTAASRGGWGEPRLIYNGETQVERATNGRRRTVHLGVDVVGPAGTPVHSPLAGVVVAAEERPDPYDYGSVVILEHTTAEGAPFRSLYGHLSYASFSVTVGDEVAAGEHLANFGEPHENGGWPPHLHLQVAVTPANFGTDWPGACDPDEWETWAQIFPNPAALLGLDDADVAYQSASTNELIAQRHAHLSQNLSVSYDTPLQAARGWKHHIFDEFGRPHLDAYNNVPHVGHAHPRITSVATKQLERINTNSRYPQRERRDFAAALTDRLPNELDTVFFINSGSEANEVALRLADAWARGNSGGPGDMIVQQWGYHGITTGALDVSHYKFARPGGNGQPKHVHVVDVPDTYRGAYGRDDDQAGEKYAAQLDHAIDAASANGRTVAGFLAESFPSVGGQHVPPPNYLAGVYERVRSAGGLCIADEVQTGLGRLGHHYWGFEQQGVVPDIVVLGKPLGNGHPLAAVVTRSDIAEQFNTGMEFFSTFGGSTLSCVVGSEVLQVIDDESLQRNAALIGDHLLASLRTLAGDHRGVGDVRGMGLFIGVDLVTDPESKSPDTQRAAYIKNALRHDRILIGTDGPADNVLKIRPPLTFDMASADHLAARIGRHLERTAQTVSR